MKHYKILLTLLSVLLLGQVSDAQVKFKLTKLEDGKTFQVALISETTIPSPLNATSTAQVTIKVPTGGFEVDQIFNLQPGVSWEPNSISVSPEESPEFDYLSFGLVTVGTKDISYEAGTEIPLFAFTNFLDCQGEISLMDNFNDPFAPPNSRQVNIGNQITILGARGDAYIGNATENSVPCQGFLTSSEQIDIEEVSLSLFPNPAADYLTVTLNWDLDGEEVDFNVRDMNGQIVRNLSLPIIKGINQAKIDIQALAQGNYFVEIVGYGWTMSSDPFVKMMH